MISELEISVKDPLTLISTSTFKIFPNFMFIEKNMLGSDFPHAS